MYKHVNSHGLCVSLGRVGSEVAIAVGAVELSVAVGAIDVSMPGEGTRVDGPPVPKGSFNT